TLAPWINSVQHSTEFIRLQEGHGLGRFTPPFARMSTRACWTITLDGHRADDSGAGSDLTSDLRRPGDCAETDQTRSYSRRPCAVPSRSPICCAVGPVSCLAGNHAPRRGSSADRSVTRQGATGSLTSFLATPGHYGYSSRHDSQAVAHQRGWIASRSSSS